MLSSVAISGFMTISAVSFPVVGAFFILCAAFSAPAEMAAGRLHFAPNGNFASNGAYLPGKIGFNLADVSTVKELDALPAGVKGLVWIGRCGGVDAPFLKSVRPYVGNPNLFGFYLMDDPDPTGRYFPRCAADSLKAESDWIHVNVPAAKTFIVLMNTGSARTPSFDGSYNPISSRIDLFGFSPYPCRTGLEHCDFDMIDRYVAAAEASGIPRDKMVPVYQAFGAGDWADDRGGRYVLPTVEQEREILARWGALVPKAVFDYTYSWGSQRGDVALHSSFDLQTLFSSHNRAD
jgi:hypothetical protein